ncbi:hypothetical protein [Bacillus thuringiensis]
MDVGIEELSRIDDPEVIEYLLFLIDEEKAFVQLIEFDYKYEEVPRPVFEYVKHEVMKSQVIDRKPKYIRARTVC